MVLNHRIEMAPFAARISLDSADMPGSDDQIGRGWVYFIDAEINRSIRYPLNSQRPVFINTWLPREQQYEFHWVTDQRIRQPIAQGASELPVGSYHLGTITTDDSGQDFDISSIVVRASLRLEGQAIPDDHIQDGQGIGILRAWPNPGVAGYFEVELDEVGDAVAELRMFPGSYSAMVLTASADVQDAVPPSSYLSACGMTTGEPCPWLESGPITIDFSENNYAGPSNPVELASVRGTLNFVDEAGQPLDAPCEGIAQLAFINVEANTSSIVTLLGENFEIELGFGRYDVWILNPWQPECYVGAMRLRQGIEINREAELNLTATLVPLTGELFMNGEPLPDNGLLDNENNDRGYLSLRHLDLPSSPQGGIALGQSGPFEVLALPGRYKATLSTLKEVGRIGLQPIPQTMLPVAIKDLGPLMIQGPTEYTPDVTVHTVQGTLRFTGPTPNRVEQLESPGISFVSANDNNTTWLPLNEDNYTFSGLVYEDSYQLSLSELGYGYNSHYPLAIITDGLGEPLWRIACVVPE